MKQPLYELACWDRAGLMLTYWCNARCRFCYVNCSPEYTHWADDRTVLSWYRSICTMARTESDGPARIHLTGGEPFGNFELVCRVLSGIRAEQLDPLEKLETNAFWATDYDRTVEILTRLAQLGLQLLAISADEYHQEYVPIERVRLAASVAAAILGPDAVRVRWWDHIEDTCNGECTTCTSTSTGTAPQWNPRDRLTGRAATHIAPTQPLYPLAHFEDQNCRRGLLRSRHIHIDPHGWIMPGTCSGILVGHVGTAEDCPDQLATRTVHDTDADDADDTVYGQWQRLRDSWRNRPVFSALATGGPVALASLATGHGFVGHNGRYASKCHACTVIRQFLCERGLYSDELGPA